jgi:hypothetical protein
LDKGGFVVEKPQRSDLSAEVEFDPLNVTPERSEHLDLFFGAGVDP